MKKFAATYLYSAEGILLRNAILVCDDEGMVLDIKQRPQGFREEAGVVYHSGILVPGFVNAHCHIEFSHLYKKIEERTGIGGFIGQINKLRNASDEERLKAIQVADRMMWAAGVVAVGDVSNSEISIQPKLKSKIYYHTFVEVFGFHPSRAEKAFDHAVNVQQKFAKQGLSATIVPHSPYSVSEPLFQKIREWTGYKNSVVSIHNQESKAELQFFKDGDGPIADHLQHNLDIDISHWQPGSKSPMEYILKHILQSNKLLLVHNTFTNENDLNCLPDQRSVKNTFFVLCPNSNLFIENTLPPVPLFQKYELNICLGTDSLASNHQLSILAEMKTLQKHFPDLRIETLLKWASINGAEALEMERQLGSFEKDKKPGVNLISGVDLKNLKFTEKSKVKRLI